MSSVLTTKTLRTAALLALGAPGLGAFVHLHAQAPVMQYTYEKIPMPIYSPAPSFGFALALSAVSTFDIQIQPGPALAANPAALAAFNRAAAQWEKCITDPVTVVISAELKPDPDLGILGGANSVVFGYPFYGVHPGELGLVQLLKDDNAGGLYQSLTDALPATEPDLKFKMDAGDSIFTGPAPYGINGMATKANFKALGIPTSFLDLVTSGSTPEEKARDSIIDFNSNQPFDYDNSDGVTPGSIDFETVAAHEIGHALGFISDLDFMDFTHWVFGDVYAGTPSTLDLFRFEDGTANDPQTLSEFSSFERSYQTGVPANTDLIFSGPAGAAEKGMSTGAFNPSGDGRQASHWKDDKLTLFNIGLMDPTLERGETEAISPSDIAALDIIGWDVPVPEVASVLPVGLVVAGGIYAQLRRRRQSPPLS